MNAERSGLCDRAFKPAFFDLLVDKNRCRSRSAKSARYGVIMKILHMFVGRHMGGDGRQYLGFAPFLSFRHVQFRDRGLQALKIALAKDEKLGDLGILHAQASDVTLVRGGGLNDPTPGAFEPVTFELNIEDPDAFNRIVGEFIAQVDAGRWPLRDPRAVSGSITGIK
ncbi:MAG: hypothetical protein J0H99_07900 [Rhodospirillales bacterium]|nr:hypothetical protein [Rhodospirillales bacterium]